MNESLLSSRNMNWCTPWQLFDSLNKEFNFVLDAAATDKSAKCKIYFTPETDGLSQDWNYGGAVFCNPPYGRQIGKWVRKAYEESLKMGGQLSSLFLQGQIPHIFTIISTEKRRFGSYVDEFILQTKTDFRSGRRHFRQ